jgi:hypothetical protein
MLRDPLDDPVHSLNWKRRSLNESSDYLQNDYENASRRHSTSRSDCFDCYYGFVHDCDFYCGNRVCHDFSIVREVVNRVDLDETEVPILLGLSSLLAAGLSSFYQAEGPDQSDRRHQHEEAADYDEVCVVSCLENSIEPDLPFDVSIVPEGAALHFQYSLFLLPWLLL